MEGVHGGNSGGSKGWCNQRYIWDRKEEGRRRVIKEVIKGVIKDIFGTGRKKEGNQGCNQRCNQRYILDRKEVGGWISNCVFSYRY